VLYKCWKEIKALLCWKLWIPLATVGVLLEITSIVIQLNFQASGTTPRPVTLCESCSESNACYFIMLAHKFTWGCWCYGSTGWTIPPISHYMLLLCDRWQQRGTVWQHGVWHGSMEETKVSKWIPPGRKKMAPVDIHWCLLNISGDQTVDVSTVRRWMMHFSSGDSGSLPLVQIFESMAYRLLFFAGDNA